MAAKSAKGNELVAHYLELFEHLGAVTPRLVFGEHAFFFQGVMFALIWEGTLYVRVDSTSKRKHEALGLKPFVYVNREGRGTAMPYFEVPPSALDDADEMSVWAQPAIAAALTANTKKKKTDKGESDTPKKPNGATRTTASLARTKPSAKKAPSAKKPSAKGAPSAKKASAKKASSAKKSSAGKASVKRRTRLRTASK